MRFTHHNQTYDPEASLLLGQYTQTENGRKPGLFEIQLPGTSTADDDERYHEKGDDVWSLSAIQSLPP
jgi:hypothetical protein